jgi:hypothetical protein
MAFFGATAQVVITGGAQVVAVNASADVGAGLAAADGLDLDICYESAGTGFVAEGLWLGPLAMSAGNSTAVTLSRSFELSPGTYTVGICGCIETADTWVTRFSVASAKVFQR